jgi:hypothetical protein
MVSALFGGLRQPARLPVRPPTLKRRADTGGRSGSCRGCALYYAVFCLMQDDPDGGVGRDFDLRMYYKFQWSAFSNSPACPNRTRW